jgi:hypothetical protein
MWDNAPLAHSRVSNINFDIWKQIVEGRDLRCIIPPRHLSQLKTRAISLTLPKVGKNFAILDIYNAPQAHSRVSNINFDIWKEIVEGGGSINIP